jgi:hypothetical protein
MPTQAVRVKNAGFLLDRLAADCAPLQEYRELTQNGIEAVCRAIDAGLIKEGVVLWDVDWQLLSTGGPFKRCVIDNGDGMTGLQIQEYINNLAVQGAGLNQSLDGNFGVGAKITAGANNPAGLVYQSWRDGGGTMARFWRDPVENDYGLLQYEIDDGRYSHFVPIADELRPEAIKSHGTKVVLMGEDEEANTALPPQGVAHPSHWLTRYLNRRYFRFPQGVTVRVREFQRTSPDEWPRMETAKAAEGAQFRTVQGHEWHLEKYSIASGSLSVKHATLHWWLLNDPKSSAFTDQNRYWQASGHVAALYQNELYEMKEGQTARRLLMTCGVVFGTNRVVIYAEPTASDRRVQTNTARSMLLVDGEPLPWDEWAEVFRNNMPEPIEKMMAELAAATTTDTHRASIQERLKAIKDLFRVTRYRRSDRGSVTVDGEAPGGSPRSRSEGQQEQGKGIGGGKGGRRDDLYGAFISPTGEQATPIIPRLQEPETEWRFEADGTREDGYLEDRAAEYLPELHRIYINGDFRVFTDMIDHLNGLYEGIDRADVVIREAVHEWFEQQLIETVMGTRALQGSRLWDDRDVQAAWSREALTAAVMPRYHVYNAIKRQLGTQLRSLRHLSTSAPD